MEPRAEGKSYDLPSAAEVSNQTLGERPEESREVPPDIPPPRGVRGLPGEDPRSFFFSQNEETLTETSVQDLSLIHI